MNAGTLLLLIDLARLAMTKGVETARRFEAHRDAVRAMIAEDREPSAVERMALEKDIAALRERLHQA
jgi:hypothetical protein